MKNQECRRKFYTLPLLILIVAAVFIGACTSPEKAKAQQRSSRSGSSERQKFQEAALEFRSALQIDENSPMLTGVWPTPTKDCSVTRKRSRK
jgi:hypothetical protein